VLWARGPNGGVDFWNEGRETARGAAFLANSRLLDAPGGAGAALPAGRNLSAANVAQVTTGLALRNLAPKWR
jgi:hypothetical protein